jgi:NACalpha-BTF3-like transcription factor
MPQELLDDMLKQLSDMGFADKEANEKALRFHYNYDEGLDAVVEDLLSQGVGPKQVDKEKEAPQDNDNNKEQLPAPVEESKEIGQSDLPGITDEDIERLMEHAHISKQAAIKALQSQLW